jgi:hypothetical protein
MHPASLRRMHVKIVVWMVKVRLFLAIEPFSPRSPKTACRDISIKSLNLQIREQTSAQDLRSVSAVNGVNGAFAAAVHGIVPGCHRINVA